MATIAKRVLGGSTDGFGIDLSATTAKTIHTGSTSTNVIDELWAWVTNSSSLSQLLNIEYGGSATNTFQVTVPPKGDLPFLVIPGFLVQGQSAGRTIAMQPVTATTSLHVYGYVNRITQ